MPVGLLDHFCFGSQGNTVIAGNWEKIQPWIIFYNILILYYHKVVEVLSKHAGLWITRDKEIMYSQATHINFICPMRFDNFPLDTQVKSPMITKRNKKKLKLQICKLQVGSYSYEMSKMTFTQSNKVQG